MTTKISKKAGWRASVRAALLTTAAVSSLMAVGGAPYAAASTVPRPQPHSHITAGSTNPLGPFVTFLFSRTEQEPAQNCVPDVTGTAPLNTVVAPYLASLGLTATGTVDVSATQLATEYCTHSNETVASSTADLQYLHTAYGWTFGPHEYDGPAKVASLSPLGDWQITCGAVQTLQGWGLGPSDGLISYPGLQTTSPVIQQLQANYGANCGAWGRSYAKGKKPQDLYTVQNAALLPPYWQKTIALKGGPGTGSAAYTDPQSVISLMQSLQPGDWLTIQVYTLVTGMNPSGDAITWSCGQPGVADTSSDVERYCYSDFQQVAQEAQQLQQQGSLTVTDPLTVGVAFGRPSTYSMTPPAG